MEPKEAIGIDIPKQTVEKDKTTVKRVYLPKTPTLVEVRPIETKKWHGKVGQESFTRPKTLQALADHTTMKYATGLNEDEVEELKTKISYDLSDNFDTENPHPFWDSPMSKVKLENKTMFFDISQPLNYIKISIMKASKYVANSMKEYEEGHFPHATHVIFDEALQAEILASKVEAEEEAIILAHSLTEDKKIELVLALDGKNLKGQSSSFIKVKINEVIKRNPQEFLRYARMNTEELSNYALVLESLQKSQLRKEGHKIYFHDSLLGMDETDVAKYLTHPENNDLKLRLMALVN